MRITVTRTTRATGEVMAETFDTERGAYDHVMHVLYDATNLRKRLCEDVAGMLTDKSYTARQVRFGPFLFTVTRSQEPYNRAAKLAANTAYGKRHEQPELA